MEELTEEQREVLERVSEAVLNVFNAIKETVIEIWEVIVQAVKKAVKKIEEYEEENNLSFITESGELLISKGGELCNDM